MDGEVVSNREGSWEWAERGGDGSLRAGGCGGSSVAGSMRVVVGAGGRANQPTDREKGRVHGGN